MSENRGPRAGFCLQCGKCCNVNHFIFENSTMVSNPHISFDEDGWCIHIDEDHKLCTIYDDRPDICRQFPKSWEELNRLLYKCGYYFPRIFTPLEDQS